MEQATLTKSTDMERERTAILTAWVFQMSKGERHISHGNHKYISPSNLVVHLGEATGDIYVGGAISS